MWVMYENYQKLEYFKCKYCPVGYNYYNYY